MTIEEKKLYRKKRAISLGKAFRRREQKKWKIHEKIYKLELQLEELGRIK